MAAMANDASGSQSNKDLITYVTVRVVSHRTALSRTVTPRGSVPILCSGGGMVVTITADAYIAVVVAWW